MSDDTPVGSVSLEDDAPAAPSDPAPASAVATPPAPAAVAASPEIDENTVQPADLVDQNKATGLIGALKSVRGEAKAAKAEAEALKAQLAQANQYLQTFQQIQALAPKPDEPKPTDDPLATQLASQLDIYTADGKPDPTRGAKVAETIRTLAGQMAQQQLAPLQEYQHRSASLENWQRAVNATATNGLKASPETLTTLWQTLPVQYTANPQIAQTLWTVALGMDAAGNKVKLPAHAPALPAPVESDPVGRVTPKTQKPLTSGERMVMQQRNMTEETYRKLTSDFKPGRATVLEED